MGDTGAMLLGLLLAYVPLSSTAMLDPNVLLHYSHTVNRYPTVLPILLPAAILVIPYADLLLAVVRRTRAGMSPFAADKKHLHHRLLNVGHSHRQSVLIMYLWAALFSASVVSLSLVRTNLIVLVGLTLAAVLVLLFVTMPRLRPGRLRNGRRNRGSGTRARCPPGPPREPASVRRRRSPAGHHGPRHARRRSPAGHPARRRGRPRSRPGHSANRRNRTCRRPACPGRWRKRAWYRQRCRPARARLSRRAAHSGRPSRADRRDSRS